MKCILCLKMPDKLLNIFDQQGVNLNMKYIISKHFWLEPNLNDDCSKNICTSCWMPLESFHKFYEEIKEAHCSLKEIKPTLVTNDDFEDGTNMFNDENIDSHLNYNMFPEEDIKVEENESLAAPIEINYHINPLDISTKIDDANMKSDSESEIPLSTLSTKLKPKLTRANKQKKVLKPKKTTKTVIKKAKTIENDEKSDNEDNKQDEKLHIHEGKWLPTSYAEETYTKPISSEELDIFLKLNTELLCGMCQKPMADFACLHPHFIQCHNRMKPFVSCCGRKLKFRAQVVDHILVHKLPNYFTCTECSKVWPSRRSLKEHLAIHNKIFNYPCEKCQKSFCSKQGLERHMEVHFEEKPFKCDECDKFYATEYRLKQHAYNMHHYKKICEQCGQVFREKDTFVRHLIKHTNGPKPFWECNICGARLSSKKILQKHHKFQHLEDSVEQNCSLCGITVKNKQALKRHLNFVHKYQRDFKCTMCDKAFKRALTLKEHMTTHTGEVLYTCPHCPKTFNSNANMHSHRKKMHRKEWEENRRHPHLGTSANAAANRQAMANQNASEDNNTQ